MSLKKTCRIKPNSGRVIVEERVQEMASKGGIVLPDTLKDQWQAMATEGRIVAMAANAYEFLREEDRPKIGDIVYFQKYDGIGLKYNNKDYRILVDSQSWGISSDYINAVDDLVVDYDESSSK